MNFVCRLDKELYKVVSDEIQTDEVIITNQQILHVNEGHPGTYERFAPHLQTVLEAPDYILRGNRPNTCLLYTSRETIYEIEEIEGKEGNGDEISELLSARQADGKPGAVRKARAGLPKQ